MIELRVLGSLALNSSPGEPLLSVLSQPKRTALLVCLTLASARGFCRRDTLLALFWPELDEEHARAQLRKQLYSLRHSLGADAIVRRGEAEVAVNHRVLWCDAQAFEAAVDGEDFERALELYRGDLLDGFHVSDALGFERWLDDERARLRQRARVAAWALAGREEALGNGVEAAHWARRAVALEPLEETGVRRLVELLARWGDRTGAVRAYEAFADRLRSDLELEPSEETQTLIERLRSSLRTAAAPPARASSEKEPSLQVRAVPASAEHSTSAPLQADTAPGHRIDEPPPARARASRRWVTSAGKRRAFGILVLSTVGVVGLLGLAVGVSRLNGPRHEEGLNPPRVVVTPFANSTGDPSLGALGYMAADWIAQGLMRSGIVEVAASTDALRVTQVLAEEPGVRWGSVPAKAVARETGAGIVVSGSYYPAGDRLVFQASVTEPSSGKLLRGVEPVTARPAELREGVELLSQRVLESLAAVADERLASWSNAASQPPSLEAYRLYAEGLSLYFRLGNEDHLQAGRLLQRAWSLDTTFTAPLIWAVFALRHVDNAAVDSIFAYLQAAHDRLAPWDGAMARYLLAERRRDWSGAMIAAEEALKYAPASEWAFRFAVAAVWSGYPRAAVDALSRVNPESEWVKPIWAAYWRFLADGWHLLGEYTTELHVLEGAEKRRPGWVQFPALRGRALGALGRLDSSPAAMDSLLGHALTAGQLYPFAWTADELSVHGHEDVATALAARLLRRYHALPASHWQVSGLRDAYVNTLLRAGKLGEAARFLQTLLAETEGLKPTERTFALGQLAVIAARQGNRARAEELFRTLENLPASDEACLLYTAVTRPEACQADRLCWLGIVAGELGQREEAVRLLRQALAKGYAFNYLHYQWGADSLRAFPAFRELMRPRG